MRAAHLSGPAAFKAVLAQPALAKAPHFVLHLLPHGGFLPAPGAQQAEQARPVAKRLPDFAVGVLTPKRFAKRAATRNALRRQIYAWFEEWRTALGLTRGWFVLRLRAPFGGELGRSASSSALKRAARAELAALAGFATPKLPAACRAQDASCAAL